MNKTYSRINWENYPSESTPLNETNLNKIDNAVNEIDNRVISLDTEKATKTELATTITSVSFNENTGIFTFTRKNGTTFTVDTHLEKLAINFRYDATKQALIITLEDGSTKEIDMSVLITQYEFLDSDTVDFIVTSDGKIKANIINGSITDEMIESGYLAKITVQAQISSQAVANAQAEATLSQSYAKGGTGTRENEDGDNAKYYYEQAKLISEGLSGALMPMGTVAFENLPPIYKVNDGWMYNISNEFTTTSDFKEGAGNLVPIGANIFKTGDGYWDVLAGSPVTGVKGANETIYRRGNVSISKGNIGLGNAENTKDADKNVATARKLATARTLQTNLSSSSSVSFDGSENKTIGVTGTLGAGNGGTGKTTLKDSANALINALESATGVPGDNTLIITKSTESSVTTYHRRPMSKLWEYIKSKITGSASSILTNNLGAHCVVTTDQYGKIGYSSKVTLAELEYLDGLTSNAQSQIDELNNKLTMDYVVERSSNVNPDVGWVWRKWSSGIKECWRHYQVGNVAINVPWGILWESMEINLPDYPIDFVTEPESYVDKVIGDGAYLMERGKPTKRNPGSVYLVRPNGESTIQGLWLSIRAIGY